MNSSETHSKSLSSKQCGREKTKSFGKEDERKEKRHSESLKEKNSDNSDNSDKKENERDELTRFVNCWNAICSECNEPTLAWLESDTSRLAPKLVEVIQRLGVTEMPDEELSKRLRLLCGKRSRPVFARIGSRFSEYNSDGLLIQTFAMHGPRVWRALEAELSELSATEVRSKALSIRHSDQSPSTAKIQQPLEIDRELERLTTNWEKACLERNQPDLAWSTEQIAQHSSGLRRFIEWNKPNRFSDDELLGHLCNVVECIAANRNCFPEYKIDLPPPIHTFLFRGTDLFQHSVKALRTTPTQEVAGVSDATD